jgi:hypothetical protein
MWFMPKLYKRYRKFLEEVEYRVKNHGDRRDRTGELVVQGD